MYPAGVHLQANGDDIIGIPAARAKSREETVAAIAIVPEGAGLTILSGMPSNGPDLAL